MCGNSLVATSNPRVGGPFAQSLLRSFLHHERNQSVGGREMPEGGVETRQGREGFGVLAHPGAPEMGAAPMRQMTSHLANYKPLLQLILMSIRQLAKRTLCARELVPLNNDEGEATKHGDAASCRKDAGGQGGKRCSP